MRSFYVILAFLVPVTVNGFVSSSVSVSSSLRSATKLAAAENGSAERSSIGRQDFFQCVSSAATASMLLVAIPESAYARGRATFEQTYRKFVPRVVTGGEFYSTEMKKLISASDFSGIKNALQEPPARSKADLTKSDSGVAARARQAGQFSDARVLVAADLFAAAFSESSISPKTKKMQAAVAKMREVIQEMESVSKQALGEESGGMFGFGSKKLDKTEASKKLRALYVEGGNAYNEYVLAANDNLALQFDKLSFIK